MSTVQGAAAPRQAVRVRSRALTLGESILSHPLLTLGILTAAALVLEIAQYRVEIVPGGHAVSVVVRNIVYGLIAAVIFEWLIVEIPGKRRSRATSEINYTSLMLLVNAGPLLLAHYRHYVPGVDSWDKESIKQAAQSIDASNPTFFSSERTGYVSTHIMGMHAALEDVRLCQGFLDVRVAQAIAYFPSKSGLRQIQVTPSANQSITPGRDYEIVWELLTASRRLYAALRESASDLPMSFGEALIGAGKNQVNIPVLESDLA
ncbi:hypothetical protein [Promicromonospora sp. NPDC059942]|uniref:hypothetical protein n=1 Tax=Promicromonospora sp. NPDC059942 TaxID=3347009 RepID=UPI00365C8771